jgi:transmembrane sensor
MNGSDNSARLDPLFREGLDWVRRIDTEELNGADRAALARWRGASPDHDAAFRQAEMFGQLAAAAGRDYIGERGVAAEIVALPPRPLSSRRAFMGGAIAASVAGALVVGRSFDFAPGILGSAPDYATAKSERRTIALAPNLSLTLDAESRANVTHSAAGHRVELLGGRAEIDARLGAATPVTLIAGKGRAVAHEARYDVSLDGGDGCVTCLSGGVQLAYGDRLVDLRASEQIGYTNSALDQPVTVDPGVASAWRRGLLIFHQTRLADVVQQVNRYRHGRIVIARDAVGEQLVSGVFHINRMDQAVGQIREITGARALPLPGGIVVLS